MSWIRFVNIQERKLLHGTVTLAIDRYGGSLLVFEEKCPNDAIVPKYAPNSSFYSFL